MKKLNWIRIIYIAGVIMLIAGILDPLEGSVVIFAGSIFVTFATFFARDKHRKLFLLSMILIAIGVFFLFYLSSLGGIGGKSGRSMWLGLLFIPYPAGWLLAIILLIIRMIKKTRLNSEIRPAA